VPSAQPIPESTRQQLLDAAERLFAEQGVHRASLRSITREAGANLASVNYHFGSKAALIREVLARRLAPLSAERLARLEALQAAYEGPPPVREIVEAFVAPVLEMVQTEPRGHAFARFGLRLLTDPDDSLRDVLLEQFASTMKAFTDALTRALPELSPAEVAWRFHFMVGSLTHIVGLGRLVERYTGGLCDPRDVGEVIRQLVRFLEGGLSRPSLAAEDRP